MIPMFDLNCDSFAEANIKFPSTIISRRRILISTGMPLRYLIPKYRTDFRPYFPGLKILFLQSGHVL